jgi:Ras-related protein Rab-4B
LASPDIVIVLVGNKTDLNAEREVTFMEASRFAQDNDLIFLETSASTGENIDEVFFKCSKQILSKIDSGDIDPTKTLSGIQIGLNPSKNNNRDDGVIKPGSSSSAASSCQC